MQNRTIDEQNELNYVEAFVNRSDIKDHDAITQQLLWLEDRGGAKLGWFNMKGKLRARVESINVETYPKLMEVWNKWQAVVFNREKVKI